MDLLKTLLKIVVPIILLLIIVVIIIVFSQSYTFKTLTQDEFDFNNPGKCISVESRCNVCSRPNSNSDNWSCTQAYCEDDKQYCSFSEK